MSKKERIEQAYAAAVERFAELGIDVKPALDKLNNLSISIHCWQADDVAGFEVAEGDLTGGIQATGNYPGKARTIEELRSDVEKALTLLPGKHRLNLHAIYGDFGGKFVDRDQIDITHFQSWIDWAKEIGIYLDFNCTCFSHPKSDNGTLSALDKETRDFWIEHVQRCRAIAEEIGRQQGSPCIHNLWFPDGQKDITVDASIYRKNMKDSLDKIFSVKRDPKYMKDCFESKLFGIGLESYTVGSNEFVVGYCVKNNIMVTLDAGHYHPTETISDKISAIALFAPEIMLHVSRPVRWDSDHVVILNDDLQAIAHEIVRADVMDKVNVGLDYFDASINRIGAYAVGVRATQKAFLRAFLEPLAKLREYEANGQNFQRMALLEECKALPWSAIYDYYCLESGVPVAEDYIAEIEKYEKDVTSKR
ncbi:MAG: L-rhamnose isomerase [Rikenellaceae bacterium]|nr:L-rhamnose isomerase [Rikenellaceae bacterium]